jgi:hypothetical protein
MMTKVKPETTPKKGNAYDHAVEEAKVVLDSAVRRQVLWSQLMGSELRPAIEATLDPTSFDRLEQLSMVVGLLDRPMAAWVYGIKI